MRVVFTPNEATQIITKCEEHLIKAGERTDPFSVDEIQGGTLKGKLITSNYAAPMEVIVKSFSKSLWLASFSS